jgi:hypothetical protein
MRHKRKIVARAKIEQNPMPQNLFFDERQPDTTHFLVCPGCNLKVYVGEAFIKHVEQAKQSVGSHVSLPRHEQCNELMQMIPIDADAGQFQESLKEWKTWNDVKEALEG